MAEQGEGIKGINSFEAPRSPAAKVEQVKQKIRNYYRSHPDQSWDGLEPVRDYTSERMSQVLHGKDAQKVRKQYYQVRDRSKFTEEQNEIYDAELTRVTKYATELTDSLATAGISEFERFNTVLDFFNHEIVRDREDRLRKKNQ